MPEHHRIGLQTVDRSQAASEPRGGPPGNSFWDALGRFDDETSYCSAWLTLQCNRVPGIKAGLLLVMPAQKGEQVLSVTWQGQHSAMKDLTSLAERALSEGRTLAAIGKSNGAVGTVQPIGVLIAAPLGTSGKPIAVAAVAVSPPSGVASGGLEIIAEQLRWGGGWLEALNLARRSERASSGASRAIASLDLLAVAGEHRRLKASVIAIANDLATRLRCDRVSIGLTKRNGAIRLHAISHSATFRDEGHLVDTIENAMEEALDQRSMVVCPPLPAVKPAADFGHRALLKVIGIPGACAASLVLSDSNGRPIGAIMLERHRDEPFKPEMLQLAETIAATLGPMLAHQLESDRLIGGRAVDFLGDGLKALFGPRRPALKLVALVVIALIALLVFAQGEHRLSAKSVLESEVQRAAVAPFDGFIRTAPVRAGDIVRQGDLLAALDDRDLVLDRLKWRAEREKLLHKEREALAKHDRTALTVLGAQIRQADSELALSEEKLLRTRIVAPFDGLIVSGDLSQMLGSPIEKGKVLFEIAPLDAYRLIIQLDERDLRYVALGQVGNLALAGLPAEPVAFTLTKIMPITVADDGRNTFRIEAKIASVGLPLRPGMEGVARIEAGPHSILWIWTHPVLDWLRLTSWKYLP
jgi:hypothetical protein